MQEKLQKVLAIVNLLGYEMTNRETYKRFTSICSLSSKQQFEKLFKSTFEGAI